METINLDFILWRLALATVVECNILIHVAEKEVIAALALGGMILTKRVWLAGSLI